MIKTFDDFGYYIMIDINEWRIIRQQCDLRYEFDKNELDIFYKLVFRIDPADYDDNPIYIEHTNIYVYKLEDEWRIGNFISATN